MRRNSLLLFVVTLLSVFATLPAQAERTPFKGESSWGEVTVYQDPAKPTTWISISNPKKLGTASLQVTVSLLAKTNGAKAGSRTVTMPVNGMEAVDLRSVLPTTAYKNKVFRGRPKLYSEGFYVASMATDVPEKGIPKAQAANSLIPRTDAASRSCSQFFAPAPRVESAGLIIGGEWGFFGPSSRMVTIDFFSPNGTLADTAEDIVIPASDILMFKDYTNVKGPATIRVTPPNGGEGYLGLIFGAQGYATVQGSVQEFFCSPRCGSGDLCGAGSYCNGSSICYDPTQCTGGCTKPAYSIISGSLNGTVGSPMDAIVESEEGTTFAVLSLPPGLTTASAGSWRLRVYGTPTGLGTINITATRSFPANCSTSIIGVVTGSNNTCNTNPPVISLETPVTSLTATTLVVQSIPVTPTGGTFTPVLPQTYARPAFGLAPLTKTIVYNLPYSVGGLSCNVSKSVDVQVPPQGGTCDQINPPSGVLTVTQGSVYLEGSAVVENAGTWEFFIYATSSLTKCQNGSFDYTKKYLKKVLACDEGPYTLTDKYDWQHHSSEYWRVVLKRNGVVWNGQDSGCLVNNANNSTAPANLEHN